MTPIDATIDRSRRRLIARAAGLAGLSLVAFAARAQLPNPPASQSHGIWALQKPFRSDGAGIGGDDVLGELIIAPGTERDVASRALVQALHQMHLSVVRPQMGLAGTIPPKRQWESDVAEVPRVLIDGYNREAPQLALPVARYGIQFKGEHDVSYSRFRYKVDALLFERGSVGPWHRVGDSRYVGDYFVGHLVSLIEGALTHNASPAR